MAESYAEAIMVQNGHLRGVLSVSIICIIHICTLRAINGHF